jgi:hypothetical protein
MLYGIHVRPIRNAKLRYHRSTTSEPRLDPARGCVGGESMSWTNPDGFGRIRLMATTSEMA